MYFDMYKYIYSESVFNTLYIEIKNFIRTKQNVQKMPFFLSQTPTYHSFSFNLRFLYELKHKGRLSKPVCSVFTFQLRFVFIKVYVFSQSFKRHN